MDQLPPGAVEILKDVVVSLVHKNYPHMQEAGYTGRVPPEDMEAVLQRYQWELAALPEDGWDQSVEVYPVEEENRWAIDARLWLKNEGPGDLFLMLGIQKGKEGGYTAEIDDLRVR